jgi:hypothetical protein
MLWRRYVAPGRDLVDGVKLWLRPATHGCNTNDKWEVEMNPDDFPAPREGFLITLFLVVSDQDRSRAFYQSTDRFCWSVIRSS